MNPLFLIFFATFFSIYGLINYYIGTRLWIYLLRFAPINYHVYWTIFWIVALSYLLARIGKNYLSIDLRFYLTVLGSYWLAAMFYFFQLFIILDVGRFVLKNMDVSSGQITQPLWGMAATALVAILLIFGSYNALNPQITRYDITINKKAGDLEQLNIAMVSDVHLGEINHNGRLAKMVDLINSLQPDIVLLPGDVIDEDIGPFVRQDMAATFKRISAPYGIYAVPGNHEYIGGHINDTIFYLEEAGVRVLRDAAVNIKDSFYIVGRDELSRSNFDKSTTQKSLVEVLQDVDKTKPLIMLNHQPKDLETAEKEGIDLQLSGHTHRGQLFPNQFVTGHIFEVDWGYLKKENLQVVVSSGYGTWGPPIRVGNRPEVVQLIITFGE